MLRIFFRHFFLAIPLLFLFWPQITFATISPTLVSPPDNSSGDKSPKLVWEYSGQCFDSGSCFRVEVDDSVDFSSPEKTTYTDSLSYSPQGLAEGVWNWRVKAKDESGTWSQWSNAFRFSSSLQPATASSPAASSQSSPTPTSTPTPQKPQSNFTIKDIPQEINSDQEFEVPVSLSLPSSPNQKFYLKGAFKKSDSLNYFGFTFSGSEFVKNNSSYSAQFKIETDKDGTWEGKIKVKPDPNDSGFDQTGGYVFKVARYNDTGGALTWSNEYGLNITAVNIPEPSSSPTTEEAEEEVESDEPDISDSGMKVASASSRNYEIKIASVAGEATKSDNIISQEPTIVLEDKKVNWFLIVSGIGVVIGGIGYVYYKIKKDKSNANN